MTVPRDSARARKWILVVDDDWAIRELWIDALEGVGYAAVGCRDGLEAAELIQDLWPDLILLDLRMPRASGWDFLESMRADRRSQRIPIVIVSGYLEEGPNLAALTGLNIVATLAKPLTVGHLLLSVEEIIGPSASSTG